MKSRFIRGISAISSKDGKLEKKFVGAAQVGFVPVKCPVCGHVIFREANKWPVLCSCGSVKITISSQEQPLAESMVLVEKYAVNMSIKIQDASVYDWCDDHITNLFMRQYLNLGRGLIPRLQGQKVASHVYYRVLRFVMLNMIATDRNHLVFLERNHLNVMGFTYMQRSDVFERMFGTQDPGTPEPAPMSSEMMFASLFGPSPRGRNSIHTNDLNAILAIYDAQIFGD